MKVQWQVNRSGIRQDALVRQPAGGQAGRTDQHEANGQQYVVIMAGGHHSMLTPAGDELIAYSLLKAN